MDLLCNTRRNGLQRDVSIGNAQRSLQVSPLDVGFKIKEPLFGLLHRVGGVGAELVAVVADRQTRRPELSTVDVGGDGRLPALKFRIKMSSD